jgi:hypothetical protein
MTPTRTSHKGGTHPTREGEAPPKEFFAARRPAAGNHAVAIVLGPVRVELHGLDDARARLLLDRYAPYATPASDESQGLRVRVGLEDREYYLDPPAGPEFTAVFVTHDPPSAVRYLSYKVAGWLDVATLRGELLLARGTWEPDLRSFENYVRVAVAWLAAARGGALVHAASAVWNDRAYLFYGQSGAGKSTLAAANRRGRIVSDDLSLVLPRDGALDLVGSPFRGTYEGGEPVVGSFPLAAGFRLVQAEEAEVRPVPRVRGFAELVGNLPFVAEAYHRDPALLESVERAFARVPLAHLHFRPDDSYWDAIARAGL